MIAARHSKTKPSRILLRQELMSKTMVIEYALEELIYLDHSYALQQSFQGNLYNSSDTGVIKKRLAKKVAAGTAAGDHFKVVGLKVFVSSYVREDAFCDFQEVKIYTLFMLFRALKNQPKQ